MSDPLRMPLLRAVIDSTDDTEAAGYFCAAVPVDISNVAKWMFDTWPEDVPKAVDGLKVGGMQLELTLPFDLFWMEYVTPAPSLGGTNFGFLIYRDNEREQEGDQGFIAAGFSLAPDRKLGTVGFFDIPNSLRMAFFPGEEGRDPTEEEADLCGRAFWPCMFAITFFHCRNVEIAHVDLSVPRGERRRMARRGLTAPPQFRQILVHAGKRLIYELPGPVSTGMGRRSHVVRGHFKNFGEGRKKLFGKLEGRFFWHPHFSGAGAPAHAVKYTVSGPQHDGPCELPPEQEQAALPLGGEE